MADALDSKSSACNGREGSTPSSGTTSNHHYILYLQAYYATHLFLSLLDASPARYPCWGFERVA